MFVFFFSLYLAMFTGTWFNYSLNDVLEYVKVTANALGQLVTSVFGDLQMTNFGDLIYNYYPELISIVLATITSIGIVIVATKGIKKLFTVFFYGVR